VTALFVFEYPGGAVGWSDLRHPVVDFTVDAGGGIWVSLDSAPGAGSVRLVEVSETGAVAEKEGALLWSLNEERRADAGAGFYGALKGMQKWSGARAARPATRREEGRRRNRQHVQARIDGRT